MNRLKDTGGIDPRVRQRKKSVRTIRVRELVRRRLQRKKKQSLRKMAITIGMKRESLRLLVKNDLQYSAYKIQRVHHLDEKKMKVRVARCKLLLQRAANSDFHKCVFTDEKIFTIEACHNHQNDRVWVKNITDVNSSEKYLQRVQGAASVMVFAGIHSEGRTTLIFIPKGVKINADTYIKDILQSQVLPWSQKEFGNAKWTFHQDSAPSPRANKTHEWLRNNFPDFITSQEWPPYSPDLNPMDYSVWAILEQKVCAVSHPNVESLKRHLQAEWEKIPTEMLAAIVGNFKKRLRGCIKARGGHIERSS